MVKTMTKKVRVHNDTDEPIELEPGQYVDIMVTEEQRRLQAARRTILHLDEVKKKWDDHNE